MNSNDILMAFTLFDNHKMAATYTKDLRKNGLHQSMRIYNLN